MYGYWDHVNHTKGPFSSLGVRGSPDWEQVVQGIKERTGQTFSLQMPPEHTGPQVRWFS